MKKEQRRICAVCGKKRNISKMRNVDTSDGTAEGYWIYACSVPNPFGSPCHCNYSRVPLSDPNSPTASGTLH